MDGVRINVDWLRDDSGTSDKSSQRKFSLAEGRSNVETAVELACRDIAGDLGQLFQGLSLGVTRERLLQFAVGQDIFKHNVGFGPHGNKNNVGLA